MKALAKTAYKSVGLDRFVRNRTRLRLLSRVPRGTACAEIGVWRGEFSKDILRVAAPTELHLIDPWAFLPEYPDSWYGGSVAKSQSDMDRIYEEVKAMFRNDPRVRVHRATSREALESLPDASLGWVYVDGNHAFESVAEDLELSFRKVRRPGLISGDDYTHRRGDDRPVKRAVDQFVSKYSLKLELLGAGQYLIQL